VALPGVRGAILVALVASPAAAADGPDAGFTAARFVVTGQLGYAYPLGSAEQGTDTRDVSFGIVPLALAAAYDLSDHWAVRAGIVYAPNVPTLCADTSDCLSSVGRDLSIGVGIVRALPPWRHARPEVDVEVGWEWLTTELVDAGVTSKRSWNGPVALVELFVDLKTQGPWRLGPTIGIGAGLFSHFDLDTPAGSTGGATATANHAWPALGFRAGRRL
jgi:hypothetical protein